MQYRTFSVNRVCHARGISLACYRHFMLDISARQVHFIRFLGVMTPFSAML